MTAGELYRWGALDDRRRRAARGAARVLGPVVTAALAGAAAAALIAALAKRGDGAGAVRLALAAVATANVMVVFATPYRMYWRRDSALLGRLPIGGDVLFQLALLRSLRATGLALIPSLAAAAAIAATAGVESGARLAAIAGASALMAALLAPSACLAAGAIVASDKAQAMLDSFGGELRAPKVSWLGTLPGLVAFAVALLGVIASGWVRLESGAMASPAIACAAAAVASVLAVLWARAAAGRVLLSAQREIAALDQERLAHIDRSTAGPLESLWGAITTRGSGRVVYHKDAALMRRRYPAPYFVGVLGIAATWILAAVGEQGTAVVVLLSLSAYALVMARRLGAPPVEHPRLLRTLPLAPGQAAAAKRSAALLRALLWCGVSGAALAVLSGDPATGAALALAATLAAAIGGAVVSRDSAEP